MTESERPRTAEQLATLPIGPTFGVREEEIDGKMIRRPFLESPPVAFWSDEHDPISWTDAEGAWKLGRYADGRWFRQRM